MCAATFSQSCLGIIILMTKQCETYCRARRMFTKLPSSQAQEAHSYTNHVLDNVCQSYIFRKDASQFCKEGQNIGQCSPNSCCKIEYTLTCIFFSIFFYFLPLLTLGNRERERGPGDRWRKKSGRDGKRQRGGEERKSEREGI